MRRCRDCGHLLDHYIDERFPRCAYWSGGNGFELVPDDWSGEKLAYAQLHCHMQRDAPACPAFSPRGRCSA